MARVQMCGWESGSALGENPNGSGAVGGASVQSTTVRTGGFAARINAASGAAATIGFPQTVTAGANWQRAYIRVAARPTSTARGIIGNAFRLRPDGAIEVFDTGGASLGTSSVLTLNTWYMVEWRAGAASGVRLRLDGVDQVSSSSSITASSFFGTTGTEADTYDIYVDDYAEDDATWPGPGKVVLLVPTAQTSITAATWQKPGGATTNLHTAVDNLPVQGIADSTSAANAERQIRNAVSNAAANVVFDMTTYTAAGIGASDTITALQAFAHTASASATSPPSGSLELLSNPVQAEANFGQFYSGAVAGIYPTGWIRRALAMVSSPSVVLGNAPSLELGKRTASTRIGIVCLVGINVEYAEAAGGGGGVGPAYVGGGYYG